jgi:uncharacterized membrane protein HdeD (DUF308 family)
MPGFFVETRGNSWPVFIVMGTIAFILGVILFLFPLPSLRFMLILAGILALVLGIILLATAVRVARDGTGSFLAPLIPGVCALVFAAVVFLNPGLVLAFAALVLGFLFLAGGLVAAGSAFLQAESLPRRIGTFAAGLLLAALGILILLHPAGAAEITIRLAGLLVAAIGILLLATGIGNRAERNPLEEPEYRVIEER